MDSAHTQPEQHTVDPVGDRVLSRSSGNRSGFVIAAIGLQLLLCSIASAADACSGTLDRIETSVAHAIREIVDRQMTCESAVIHDQSGYRLNDCARGVSIVSDLLDRAIEQRIPCWLLNLPPPSGSSTC
ncbi:MAG: hypothetical protein ACWA5W_00950 [Phycisphaerales bacterium]